MSKVDLRLQCGMPCSKLEVSTVQHGTLSGAGYLHQSPYWIASFRDWRRFTKFPALDNADTLSSLPLVAPRLLAHHQDDAAF